MNITMVEMDYGQNSLSPIPDIIGDINIKQISRKKRKFKNEKPVFNPEIVWTNVILFVLIHAFGIYGLVKLLSLQMKNRTFIYSYLLGLIAGDSITIGAHRLWSHRSFKAKLPLKIVLLFFQTVAGQNSLWEWVRDHRQHHKFSDTDADPHNSKRGFFFSHMGWLMMKKHPDVIKAGKTVDMSDLNADPYVMFQKKYYKPLYFIFGHFLPILIPILFWDETFTNSFLANFARYMLELNITWCVNSVAHIYGTRPYTKDIDPVESSIVSFMTSGEGWHNFHHSFPWDYRAAEYGRSYNANSIFIEWLEKLGLAYDLKKVTPEMVAHRIIKKGDGSLDVFQEENF